jgi:hypothetical protein
LRIFALKRLIPRITGLEEKQMSFEIGLVYRSGIKNRYYLAIEENLLLSAYDNDGQLLRPYRPGNYSRVNKISVEELCEVWGITLEQLDILTLKWLTGALAKDPTQPTRGVVKEPYMPLIVKLGEDD